MHKKLKYFVAIVTTIPKYSHLDHYNYLGNRQEPNRPSSSTNNLNYYLLWQMQNSNLFFIFLNHFFRSHFFRKLFLTDDAKLAQKRITFLKLLIASEFVHHIII